MEKTMNFGEFFGHNGAKYKRVARTLILTLLLKLSQMLDTLHHTGIHTLLICQCVYSFTYIYIIARPLDYPGDGIFFRFQLYYNGESPWKFLFDPKLNGITVDFIYFLILINEHIHYWVCNELLLIDAFLLFKSL